MTATATTSLYQASAKLYPRTAHGRYARLRIAAMLALLGLYYLFPWLSWNGGPLLLLDLPHRRFHVFGLTLLPQDLWLLTGLLVVAALALFFFTTLAGRLWCGYACPQTVWTEAFLWMERITEGDRHARLKLDQAPWTAGKLLRKSAKHWLWASFALYTGLTFVAYFIPARELFPSALIGTLGGWALFWALFYGFATWGNAGFLREQVCKYMCPYARFQAAMFDADTLLIAYDERRGEPRKSVARKLAGPATRAAGDCVDCSLCVQVCPTGIDIRKGLQYECIACAACIDACDGVMDAIGKPRGLIRYSSGRQEAGGALRVLRPRVIGYGLALLALVAGLGAALALRVPLQLDVLRDRHALYRELPDGRVENLYTLHIVNTATVTHRYRLEVRDERGQRYETTTLDSLELQAGERRSLSLPVRAPQGARPTLATLRFTLRAVDDPQLSRSREARFLAGETP